MVNGMEIFLIPVIVGLAAMSLAMLPDIANIFSRHIFVATLISSVLFCAITIPAAGVDFDSLANAPSADFSGLWDGRDSKDRKIRRKIGHCKSFVSGVLAGKITDYSKTGQTGIIKAGFKSKTTMWEHCAKQFGVNYWKYDTTIGGREGGKVLCDAYRKSSYRSAEVETWCSTVFASRKGI
jgi:hypothetical protein